MNPDKIPNEKPKKYVLKTIPEKQKNDEKGSKEPSEKVIMDKLWESTRDMKEIKRIKS